MSQFDNTTGSIFCKGNGHRRLTVSGGYSEGGQPERVCGDTKATSLPSFYDSLGRCIAPIS